jgi:hypothetical protein
LRLRDAASRIRRFATGEKAEPQELIRNKVARWKISQLTKRVEHLRSQLKQQQDTNISNAKSFEKNYTELMELIPVILDKMVVIESHHKGESKGPTKIYKPLPTPSSRSESIPPSPLSQRSNPNSPVSVRIKDSTNLSQEQHEQQTQVHAASARSSTFARSSRSSRGRHSDPDKQVSFADSVLQPKQTLSSSLPDQSSLNNGKTFEMNDLNTTSIPRRSARQEAFLERDDKEQQQIEKHDNESIVAHSEHQQQPNLEDNYEINEEEDEQIHSKTHHQHHFSKQDGEQEQTEPELEVEEPIEQSKSKKKKKQKGAIHHHKTAHNHSKD